MMTSTGSDLNVFLEGSESERAWSGPDWQVSHSLPHLSKCGESIRMQQKYFIFFSKLSHLYCCQGEDPDELLITDDDEELKVKK